MRYFKKCANYIRKVVGEMINITYGTTYYSKGDLVDKPTPKHNSYNIDDVEYEIVPNKGIVYGLYGLASIDSIKFTFGEMVRNMETKFGRQTIPVGTIGTTHYMVVKSTTQEFVNITDVMESKIANDVTFTWIISQAPPVIPEFSRTRADTCGSLSCIIYDRYDDMELPDSYSGPNYPSVKEYKKYSQGLILADKIIYHPNYGLALEIIKHYPECSDIMKKYVYKAPSTLDKVTYAKWEWLSFYTNDNILDPVDLIKKGIFSSSTAEPSDSLSGYKCFMTNVPIYEDCYVFDIYEQVCEEQIDKEDLPRLQLEYADCSVVDVEAEALAAKKAKASKSKRPFNSKKKKANYDSEDLDDENAEDQDQDQDQDSDEESKVYKPTKTGKLVRAMNVKALKAKNPKTKVILKRGQKKPTDLITVRYTKKYKEPKCILISPYYVHLANPGNPASRFEVLTRTKIIVYRTFCPVTLDTVIKNSDADELVKKVLLSMNEGFKYRTHSSEGATCEVARLFDRDPFLMRDLSNDVGWDKIVGVIDSAKY